MLKFIILVGLAWSSLSADDSKWVWKGNGRSSGAIVETVAKPRYEIIEDDVEDFAPTFNRPPRPGGITQAPGFPNRPDFQGPFGPNQGFRPDDAEVYPESPFGNGYRPVDHGAGILTGPIPSWVREYPFKEFDKCKCAEKFNCNSPGISYGQCDVGKQYCCYHTKKPGAVGSPFPSRPFHTPENGILAGPSGPGDYPVRPNRPYPRPPAFDSSDILVGPGGGPSGLFGRPTGGNFQNSELGVLVGPGARPGNGGYGFGRSAKTDKN